MIINGGGRGSVGYWSGHLTNTKDNDRAELKDIRGLCAENLPDALREMQAISMGSRSQGNFMYVADINPCGHERLTDKQWVEAIDALEKSLGLEGHQRVIIEHEKEGRVHRHVVWNRVDVDTMRVKDIGGDFYSHERVARELEIKFDLQRGQSLHGERRQDGRPERAPELWEQRAAERTGIGLDAIKAEFTDLWRTTDSGKAFAAALDERGYILAEGKSRAFCVVDHAGTVHSLAKRIEDATVKDVKARFADIDRASLPTAEAAQQMQRAKYPSKEQALGAWKARDKESVAERVPAPPRDQDANERPEILPSASYKQPKNPDYAPLRNEANAYDSWKAREREARTDQQPEATQSPSAAQPEKARQDGLRDAIKARDVSAVLEALTRQNPTFTAASLERGLAKEISAPLARAQFGNAVLDHAETVHLSNVPGGATTRYTTRSVMADEQKVVQAAASLAGSDQHGVSRRVSNLVLDSQTFSTMRDEQKRAFDHATGSEGIAIIDGQAGTGKSYTMSAIRTAYSAQGCHVVGLAPTNVVAADMKEDGFHRAATLDSELFSLKKGRTQWDRHTVVMVDEAAMIDTKIMAQLTEAARDAGAKLILVGDDRQLSSIECGGMFSVLKDRHGAAALTEVARQHTDADRLAASLMAGGNFKDALGIYEAKGGINWTTTQDEARQALVDKWANDSASSPEKSRFVFAYTNADVKDLNAAIREVRQQRGELGADHVVQTADGEQKFAIGDRVQFTGTNKKAGLYNGTVGTLTGIEGTTLTVKLDGKRGDIKTFDTAEFGTIRYGYAGTIYRGQGRTLDQTYLYHSEHWRSAASYVALTRHRDKAEIFVATDTLNARPQGEPWMKEQGGAQALDGTHLESAQRSYAKWQETNPQAAARHGFADYVDYVQEKWAQQKPDPAKDREADLSMLARQMARTDERRAASQFHAQPWRTEGIGQTQAAPEKSRADIDRQPHNAMPEPDRRDSGQPTQQAKEPHAEHWQPSDATKPEKTTERVQESAERGGSQHDDDHILHILEVLKIDQELQRDHGLER